MMSGHESKEEAELIGRLEANLDLNQSPIEDLLELGQLYIEPAHREDEAIRLFEAVLRRDPDNAAARFWLANIYLRYLMDQEALKRAVELLGPVLEDGSSYTGAAFMLLAEILEEPGDLPLERKIQLLEASAELEPEWVYNRQSLAWAYSEAGRFAEALAQLQRARANVIPPDPNWTLTRRNFEESVTGRAGHRVVERLDADIEKVSGAMQGEASQK